MKRRRFKQTSSLAERLTENIESLKSHLATVPHGPEREQIVRRIRQNETASHVEDWLKSPGLQPPKAA